MRVLIDYRPALRARTGVGEWVHRLVAALGDPGADDPVLDITIFSSSWKDRLQASLPGVSTVDARVPVRVLNYWWHRWRFPPVEWLARDSFDVVHSPHPLLIPTRGAAQVVTVHDLNFLDHPEWNPPEIQRDYATLVRHHVHQAAHVVVPSDYTAREVTRRLGVPPERITRCANGAPAWPPRQTAPADGHLLFVGAIAPRKNVGSLLDAYRQLMSRRADLPELVLAGPPTRQGQQWLDAIGQPPLRGRVRCTGYLPQDEVRTFYEQARVLILPSLDEGFGLPALEAMTVGVPVVVSNRGALPEIVGDAGVVIDPSDTDGLADAIEQLLDDDDRARACVERGFAQAARYQWRDSAKRLRQAYTKAVQHT